jgi:hypothetical protein
MALSAGPEREACKLVTARETNQEQWLAAAAEALAEAERLTGQLAIRAGHDDLTLASLQSEIMGLRREIERMRRKARADHRADFHPDWLRQTLWTQDG